MLRFRLLLLLIVAGSFFPAAAQQIDVDISYPQSMLNITVDKHQATPATIKGQIRASQAAEVDVYVSNTSILFIQDGQRFSARVTGTIGGRPVTTYPVQLLISPQKPLLIDLTVTPIGAIRQSNTLPAGSYTSQPFQVYATLSSR